MDQPIRITSVSYSNSLPFVFGIENSGFPIAYSLNLRNPAGCAKDFRNGDADIALVPVGALDSLKNYKIISNYCIGAKNAVRSVLLLSQLKIDKIRKIYLDSESETSVKLVKILCRHYWKINPVYEDIEIAKVKSFGRDAYLVIGDKALDLAGNFSFSYDLAESWYQFQKIPFVFAVWVANKDLESQVEENFNLALKFGIENIRLVTEKFKQGYKHHIDLNFYLTSCIDFHLDKDKLQSIRKYLDFLKDSYD